MEEEAIPSSSSSEPLDLDSIRTRITELESIHRNYDPDEDMPRSDSDQLLKDCALQLESEVNQIMSECDDFSFLGIEDLDAYLVHLKEELSTAEAESARISNEIELLTRTHVEDSSRLECELEVLKSALDLVSSQDPMKEREGMLIDSISCGENESKSEGDEQFEILKLEEQIEESQSTLKSLQDFDSVFKRFDAIEQIEDAFSGLKVIDFDGTSIRLSLCTCIPNPEDIFCKQKIGNTAEPSEVNHELLIQVTDGTMEFKNVEMFPNDVYIGDIIDSTKSFRQAVSVDLMCKRSPLEWFVRKVQDRIVQSTLIQLVIKGANKSRCYFEYLDRDETIVAHLVGGVDAFIKVSQGWPLSDSPLKLISLKSSDHSKEISFSFLPKVEEMANSWDVHLRQNLSSFVDAVEKVLLEQTRMEVQSDNAPKL